MRPHLPRTFCLAAALFALPALAGQPAAGAPAAAATKPAATPSLVPQDGDEFAKFVERAESGATDIDFLAMRNAWVQSATYLRVSKSTEQLAALRKPMFEALDKDPGAARDYARKILAINYIDLDAQMVMKQTCQKLGDKDCYDRYHYVEIGLLKSIAGSGDGRSCATAWEVVSVDEEYFILNVMGFRLDRQLGPGPGGMCDTMIGTQDGKSVTYYFGVEKAFEGYRRFMN